MKRFLLLAVALTAAVCCGKVPPADDPSEGTAVLPKALVVSAKVDGRAVGDRETIERVSNKPTITLEFSREVKADEKSLSSVQFEGGALSVAAHPADATKLVFTPESSLSDGARYKFSISAGECFGVRLKSDFTFWLSTKYDIDDQTDKFERISDEELFEKVQKAAFSYFWDYGHPVSGLARERLGSGDTVTSGGSGFGLMAIPVGIERGWISRTEGAQRLLKIVDFLGSAERFHGAWPHWLSGATGKAIAFSTNDNGADLVETAFLVEGLLAARAYFDGSDALESEIRTKITALWEGVEWTWFQQGGQKALYWHWSPDKGWAMNMKITSWNEAQIVYILAASSPTYPISKDVYDQGWNGSNGYNYRSPLFFVHYSFLGLDPRKLKDAYASYWEQNCQHARTNYEYCVGSDKGYGYSAECWGLTASDYYNGYTASSPSNDTGTVAPTAALASFPYMPEEALAAMKYFYYKLGNKTWGTYGFYDSFALAKNWFASSYIAIDEGPIVVMMENYRTGLIWDSFMKDRDVQAGLTKLGFTWK